MPTILSLLECYLSITQQTLDFEKLKRTSEDLFDAFLGALGDPKFLLCADKTREQYRWVLARLLRQAQRYFPQLQIPTSDMQECVVKWNRLDLDKRESERWRGWWVRGKEGDERFLPLEPIWSHFGPPTAYKIHAALLNFWQSRECASMANSKPLFVELFKFAAQPRWCDRRENVFNDPVGLSELMFEFCEHIFGNAFSNQLCLSTTQKRWNDWRFVVQSALLENGVWAMPNPPIPRMPLSELPGALTKIRKMPNGIEVKEKLIVDVPIEITDDEAIELLLGDLISSIDAVVAWASARANALIDRMKAARAIAQRGVPIQGGNSRRTLQEIRPEDVAATFKARGLSMFQSSKVLGPLIGGGQAARAGYMLGIPMAHDLEPFMYLLINEDPKITDSFLRNLKIFDKHGKFSGFNKTDNTYVLIGMKKRKGAAKAQQKIYLSPRAVQLVQQVLDLTEPLRAYLKEKRSPDWRYLFLSCSKGLNAPGRVKPLRLAAAKGPRDPAQELKAYTTKRGAKLSRLVDRITLSSFRASRGLRVYLETHSAEAMSVALGHDKYRPGLLARYLPDPILRFFQSRWMRIFQTAIICEAMKGSPLLLRATGFCNMSKLHEFLRNHMLKPLPAQVTDPVTSTGTNDRSVETAAHNSCIHIDVGLESLALLCSLDRAVKGAIQPVNGRSRYWTEFYAVVKAEIKRQTHDKRLQAILRIAEERSNPSAMASIIYE